MTIERIRLVGLSFVGRSIASCLLSRGFHVTAYSKGKGDYANRFGKRNEFRST